jgi:putative protein kinase ArgK-like GTPase of G3E family
MLLAEADITSVPAELIKHLLTLALAFAGVWFANKRASRGSKESPVSIEQPLNVKKHDEMVRKSEVDKVEASLKKVGDRVESLADQINAQFAAMTKAGQDRAAAITQSMDEELRVIFAKIETFMLMTSRHDAVIPQIEERVHQLAKEQHDAMQRVHARIDDAVRLQASRKS